MPREMAERLGGRPEEAVPKPLLGVAVPRCPRWEDLVFPDSVREEQGGPQKAHGPRPLSRHAWWSLI